MFINTCGGIRVDVITETRSPRIDPKQVNNCIQDQEVWIASRLIIVGWGDFATFSFLLTPSHQDKVIFDYEKVPWMGQCDKLSNYFAVLPW